MAKREFSVETDETLPSKYLADASSVRWENGKYWAELKYDGDDFVYSWFDGTGEGETELAASMVFDLPVMLTLLNLTASHRLFAENRIYEKTPEIILFERKK